MPNGKHIFRADHIGSFLRPKSLIEAARSYRTGALSGKEFRESQDQAIAEVVTFQDSIGLPSVTDGEYRRAAWSSGVIDAIEGIIVRDAGTLAFKNKEGDVFVPPSPFAETKVKRSGPIVVDDYNYLNSLKPRGLPKVTMASPPVLHFFLGDQSFDRNAYPDKEGYFADLASIYRAEIADLAIAGCTFVQLDDTALPCNCDITARKAIQDRGEDPDTLTDAYIQVINDSISERPDNMTIGLHMCRGNLKGMWMGEGGYEPIAEKLFNQLDVDTIFMEYDSKRAGDFRPLRHVPKGKLIVLGLISAKSPILEEKEEVRSRIDDAAAIIPMEQLALSAQCGFSSGSGDGQVLGMDDTKRKLNLIVELADEIWGSV
ncbi:MAG: 5-methyltetrahydropteroyltriglutamate--homocysteine methyltransferase [Alphaproteobacteria bacterium MarineAlpha11_Bin1]|nr:MAG: 5-methyltetrahydropteroyltriglutamate--homocysteine methyltransferase [Alphaproteobacteria bacterium MarineAlpha11_Bin1]|tara:strand:+ start:2525 stop:3643 length:1119 start_codon:yes stop_codon:yes gene_type:complete